MAKDKLTDYDATASNNTDVGGISVAEGMLPSGVNNAIREQMSHLADFASGTSGVDVLKLQDDTDTNSIKLQAPASVTADTTFTMPDGDGSADQVLKTDGAGQLGWADRHANPSLIINGAMTIDQRNSGSSLTVPSGGGYSLDRWAYYSAQASKFTIQQSTETPTGYKNSLLVTSSSAYTVGASESFSVRQYIEGQNIAHLEFGNSNAKTVTLSFWVRSSLTGSFGGVFWDGVAGTSFYPFSYTISSADTWEQKTVTIDGRQSGTWATDITAGAAVQFSLGAGSSLLGTADAWTSSEILAPTGSTDVVATSGATWHLTGVQLEVGETATPFDHSRSYGEELALCQRYYQQYLNPPLRGAMSAGSAASRAGMILPVPMRATPSVTMTQTGSTSHAALFNGAASYTISSIQASYLADFCIEFDFNLASAPAAATPAALYQSSTLQSKFAVSAEL